MCYNRAMPIIRNVTAILPDRVLKDAFVVVDGARIMRLGAGKAPAKGTKTTR